MQHILSRITKERLPELRAALNRALNTWEDAPKWLVELCDCLDASSDSAVRYGANYDLHPYQQRLIDLINNTPYAKPVRVSPVMIDEIPEFEDQLPFWAEMAVPAGHDGYGYVRAQLCTRDGRVMGNAVIESLEHRPEGKTLYTVLTDMGNRIRMNYAEMADQFHAPKWVMKEDAIGKRLDKMTRAEMRGEWESLKAVPPVPSKLIRSGLTGLPYLAQVAPITGSQREEWHSWVRSVNAMLTYPAEREKQGGV